jgi:hypothetical protein
MQTLRRLNDRERYYGLTFPGWIAVACSAALLYVAIQVSPFGTRATVTIVVLVLAFAAMVIAGVSGQALSPARHLAAIVRYHRAAKQLELAERPDKRGLVLDSAPQLDDVDAVRDPLVDLSEGIG